MRRSIPSIGSLKAFEAAAKRLSFTEAAVDLSVSQAAVSSQVRALEDHLGVKLFVRLNRVIMLTESGLRLYKSLGDVLDNLESILKESTLDAKGTVSDEKLTIGVDPAFADLWLVNRLRDFRQKHNNIQPYISLNTYGERQVLMENVDIEIYYGSNPQQSLYSELLMKCTEFPVCSPKLLTKDKPLNTLSDVKNYTLLHYDSTRWWRDLLISEKVSGVDYQRGPVFHDDALCLNMAIAGEGIAIGDDLVSADALTKGELIKPFSISKEFCDGIYFVCKPENMTKPAVMAFYQWIKDKVSQHLISTEVLRKREPYINISTT